MTLYVQLLLSSRLHLIISVLSVTFLQSNLLTMQNSISYNHLRGTNLTTFKADIRRLISPTICPTYEMLDDSLRLILEKHAPLHTCRVPINRSDPRNNAMKSDIIAAEKQGHWAERQHIKNPTILNKQQFNKA